MGGLAGLAFLSGACFAILLSSATRRFSLAKSNFVSWSFASASTTAYCTELEIKIALEKDCLFYFNTKEFTW